MKHLLTLMLIVLVATGCAGLRSGTKKDAMQPLAQTQRPEEVKLNAGLECLKTGIEARTFGKDREAVEAFGHAMRYLTEIDEEDRSMLRDAAEDLRRIIVIAGFEYAPKESMELLVVYLEMQNAYADHASDELKRLKTMFESRSDQAKEATAMAKQKRLEALGQEVAVKKEEIKKQAEPDILQVYPSIYIVKKGDTLPSIAARYEVYNDSFMWPLIYKANRDQIKDPKVLYTGQDLKIPRDMSMDDIIQARREAGAPEPEKIPKDAVLPRRTK
jgi:LysM repeat protein